MDVLYFLKERTRLIRDYYEHAARPFNENIRKIEANELLEVTGRRERLRATTRKQDGFPE
jgi:hypothetical protein